MSIAKDLARKTRVQQHQIGGLSPIPYDSYIPHLMPLIANISHTITDGDRPKITFSDGSFIEAIGGKSFGHIGYNHDSVAMNDYIENGNA